MEEQRREAMLTLERKEREAKAAKKAKQMAALERKEMAALRKEVSRRKKTEKALVEMRERAERNDRVIQKSEKQGKGGILTRSKTGAPKTAKQTLSKKSTGEIDFKTENLRSDIAKLEDTIRKEETDSLQKKEKEYSDLQDKYNNLQETYEQMKRKERETRLDSKIRVLKEKYAALQQKVRNLKKSSMKESKMDNVRDVESESGVRKKKKETASNLSEKDNKIKRRKWD